MKKMKKSTIVVLGIVGVLILWVLSSYTSLVNKDEDTQTAWSQVENVYQRRADLIPNLVSTVKGYAAHEKATFQAVVEARAKATSVKIDANEMTPEKLKAFDAAQGELSSSLSKLMVVVENYPNLKADQSFLSLQSQLEGTENRITVERMRFNEAAKIYNKSIRNPFNIIFAKLFGFEKRPYFEAQQGAENAPEVTF